jgi:hypothetical protein
MLVKSTSVLLKSIKRMVSFFSKTLLSLFTNKVQRQKLGKGVWFHHTREKKNLNLNFSLVEEFNLWQS